MKRILLLGGTTEARQLEAELSSRSDYEVIVSLAGRTKATRNRIDNAGCITHRIGGFGGADGLCDFLRNNEIDVVLDVTHPFADQISWNAHKAATSLNLPLLRLQRPIWQPQAEDRWISSPDMAHAINALETGKRYLLAIGRQEAHHFATRTDCWFLSRSIEPLPQYQQIPNGEQILYQPDGDVFTEREILATHAIDGVICKNSGGESGFAKLKAARDLGLIVHMIERPSCPACNQVNTIQDMLLWLYSS